MPTGAEYLRYPRFLRRGRFRRRRLHQLGKSEDGVERASELVAHARQEIRLGEARLLGDDLGAFQLGIRFLQGALESLSLGDIARGGKDTLKSPLTVIECRRIVGDHRLLPVPSPGRKLVVGDLFLRQDELDARLGAVRIREVSL